MKKQFKDDLERIQEQNHPNIEQLIEKNVRKHRRIRQGRNILISFSVLILSFTALVNYHDRFYVYAQNNPYLKKIAESVRFKDIFEESASSELGKDQISLKEPFEGEIKDHEMKEIIIDNDDYYFTYHQSQNKQHYFLRFEHSEGLYDPIDSIWRYDDEEFVEIFNMKTEELQDNEAMIQSLKIDGQKLYLVFADGEKQKLYIYDMKKEKAQFVDESLYMNVFHQDNGLEVVGAKQWYLKLEKLEQNYVYQLCSLTEDHCSKIRSYEGDFDPYQVPIIRLLDAHQSYFLIHSLKTDRPNWEENTRDFETEETYHIVDKEGTIISSFKNLHTAMFQSHLLVYQKEEKDDVIYGAYDLIQNKKFETADVTEFYYHLREEGIVVFALTGEEAWFKNIQSSSPNLRTNLAKFTSTQDKLEARYFIFPDSNPYYIVLDDKSSKRIEIHEITYQ